MTALKYPIVPGDRFGRLIVTDATSRKAVACKCDCGTERRVQASALYGGYTKSCGCLHSETSRATGRANARLPIADGTRFGMLLVLDSRDRNAVVCECDCGREKILRAHKLTSGHNRSCGCFKASGTRRSHGLTNHALFPTWQGMVARCTVPTATGYQHYGGRGIRVCDRWHDVTTFVAEVESEIGPRPEGMTLDRIDVDGHYESGNIRWANRSDQARNRRQKWTGEAVVTCPCGCGHTFQITKGLPDAVSA